MYLAASELRELVGEPAVVEVVEEKGRYLEQTLTDVLSKVLEVAVWATLYCLAEELEGGVAREYMSGFEACPFD